MTPNQANETSTERARPMIDYKDFAPKILEKRTFFKGATFETFEVALAAANAWIKSQTIKVLNIETIVLPILMSQELGPTDANVPAGNLGLGGWHQFIRVWFEAQE